MGVMLDSEGRDPKYPWDAVMSPVSLGRKESLPGGTQQAELQVKSFFHGFTCHLTEFLPCGWLSQFHNAFPTDQKGVSLSANPYYLTAHRLLILEITLL